MTTKDAPLYGDKTLPEWDQRWVPIPEWQAERGLGEGAKSVVHPRGGTALNRYD